MPRVLQLDVDVLRAEDLGEAIEFPLARGERRWSIARQTRPEEAAGERDHPFGVALEQLPVDARLVVVALEVAERARA